jgi:hypothetical protein
MKTTAISAVSFSGWGFESIPGGYVLRPVPQHPCGESKWIMRERWMEPCFLPTISCPEHHKGPNSTISSLLTSEFRIQWSIMPDVHGVVLHSCHCPRDKKRVTKNYVLKAPNTSFPKSMPCLHSSMETTGRFLTPYWVLDLVHIWFQVTQAPLQSSPASCGAQTAADHRAPPTAHSPQLQDFQMFPASKHHGRWDHEGVCEDSSQWKGLVSVWSLPYLCPQWLELKSQPSIGNGTWFSSHSIFSVTQIYVQ